MVMMMMQNLAAASRKGQRGFTIIELLVVVTIVGILAGLAVVNVRHAQRKAKEEALRYNLTEIRKAIDSYYADRQAYPPSLQDLVPNYLKRIPMDPITESSDTWVEIADQPDFSDPGGWDSWGSGSWDDSPALGPGVIDVKSGAEGETMDKPPVPYSEL
jgi:general secretion pathway protein G